MRVGLIDSGVGGLTVLLRLLESHPNHDYFYLGDTANMPYGSKNPQQIKSLAVNATRILVNKGIDNLVIACNTASAIALDDVRQIFPKLNILSLVDAGTKFLLESREANPHILEWPIAIAGTPALTKTMLYTARLRERLGNRPLIFEIPFQNLAQMIESGDLESNGIRDAIERELASLTNFKSGTLVLGCSHYPWVAHIFQSFLPGWTIIDPAYGIVENIRTIGESSTPRTNGTCSIDFTARESVATLFLDLFNRHRNRAA